MKLKHIAVVALVALGLASPAKAVTNSVASVGTSTPTLTAVMLATGAGSLAEVEITSATAAGDFCLFIDTANVNGININHDGRVVAGVNLAPVIAMPTAPAVKTNYTARGGPFTNGLAAICSGIRRALARIAQ